ncbi:MAG: hypothetical protein HY727_07595 [Candidatus Rokubacteria bacterium]|nr:hypothetical protein [Candidatus Rokubacteria bacterium]
MGVKSGKKVNEMEWVVAIATGLGLLIVLAPLVLLLATVFVLVPLAHLLPPQPTVARTAFDCPFSKRHVRVAFVAAPGADRPSDVLSCSVFMDGRIRCKKGCVALAEPRWAPSPMVSRFALIADGVTYR